MAEAEDYCFDEWTGDVNTVADINAVTTSISMKGDYAITAKFDDIAPVNRSIISGLIAAVVAVGLGFFLVRSRRLPRLKGVERNSSLAQVGKANT